MKGKLSLLVGGAIGYVLGTRAGREQYDKIVAQAQGLWGNPKVQDAKAQAQDFAKQKGPEVGQKVANAASGAASAAQDKVGGGSDGKSSPSTTTTGTSTSGATGGTTPTGTTTPPPTS
jgi:membrane protein involved in colicin uptake